MIKEVYSEEDIAQQVARVAGEIASHKYQDLVLLIVLRGGIFFGADLARALWRVDVPLEMDFMNVSKYKADGVEHSITLRMKYTCDMRDRDVIVVDDSCNSGDTFAFIRSMLLNDRAYRVKLAVIHAVQGYTRGEEPTYSCFAPHEKEFFRIGYGEDVDDKLREVPFIGDYTAGWQTLERYRK